jgi:peptidylprolyl isomerase
MAAAAAPPPPQPAALPPTRIVELAPDDAWLDVAADDLLVVDLPDGPFGPRRVLIALTPAQAPTHVANIRKLVADGWFVRHSAIVRVQENYVVQWGDHSGTVPLPPGLVAQPTDGYEQAGRPAGFRALPYPDPHGVEAGHAGGWAMATDGKAHWLPHCPTMVGVGRNMPPDTGTGAELYAVIGHGPRHLDRNIALVGRVVDGMEHLSSLPRGLGALGFYTTPAAHVPLVAVRLASDLPEPDRPRVQLMRTDAPAFAAWVDARANRRDAFFVRPAGGADLCNLMPPVKRIS